MANPGVGNKFVSVNLNKSYGHHQHQAHHSNSSHSGYYGSNRTRTGSGGGMVVLSRPRSSQKPAGPKLSVPPPLNLPSLRKEHERFDTSGSGTGPAGGGASGSGTRPGSSGMGWTKPGTALALQEKEAPSDHVRNEGVDHHSVDGGSKGSGAVYMPPSVRSGSVGPVASPFTPPEKATVLRGEDFPSLQAALPALAGNEKKHKDGLNQKQKRLVNDALVGNNEMSDGSRMDSTNVDMRPQLQLGHGRGGSRLSENRFESRSLGGSRGSEQVRKQDDYFLGPLPLVRLNPRSDWADDERDTGLGFKERDRDHGFSKSEAYWERDFDMPRPTVLPHKPVHNSFDRWGQRDNEAGKVSSSEVAKLDSFGRDARMPSREGREGNLWRASSPLQKDGFGVQETGSDRISIGARPPSLNRESNKESKYVSSPYHRDTAQDDFGRRDLGSGQGVRQPWNNLVPSYNAQRADRNSRERYGSEQYNRFKGDTFQNSSVSKSSFSAGSKGLQVSDPILNFGRDKRPSLKSEKPYQEDPFMKDFGSASFDGRDPFSGGLVGVVKKKKDMLKQTDFHDPVRESFEAELERVQKMQEQERQRIIEEQERALELARREEEERLRVVREQEEQRRRLEDEAREAAWRAEQEQLDAMRKVEEQRIAREEEKQRIAMEEERRKQAAKQKLLELEERIAKRQAEAGKSGSISSTIADEKLSGTAKERPALKMPDFGDWEDGERMVERITTSASSDSSGLTRPFDMSCRPQFARDNSSALLDRGKPVNSWRRDAFENGNSSAFIQQDAENGHYSPRRDAAVGGRTFPRKEFYGGPGFMSARNYYKTGILEPQMDDFSHTRVQRWNASGDGDNYGRNTEMESDFNENLSERYGDGWAQGRYHGNPYLSYTERLYPSADADGVPSFGRPRHSMRHPRVLPPPSLSSMQKTSYRRENERPGPSTFPENEIEYSHGARTESIRHAGFDSGHQDNRGQPEIIDVQQERTANEETNLDENTTPRCDSQSSLSVSSPPDSPVHLSHDDLDESGDSLALSAAEEGKGVSLSGQGNDPVVLPTVSGKENMMIPTSSVSGVDDEEWTVDNEEQLPEQEEYDEDEDGYEEEDEVHEGDDGNIDLTREFEDMRPEEKGSPNMMNNLVLGFNEGVEVAMPNDEFERSPPNEELETTFAVPQISAGIDSEEQGSFDGISGTLQPMDVPSQASISSTSRIFQETEKAMQHLVIQSNSAPQLSAASELIDHVDANSNFVVSSQHPATSSVNMVPLSSSDQTVTPTASSGLSQAETPVKLQFGLFSGPSLIPSPVPAIQIGSIQMPLLHPQVGPSLTHLHAAQPPIFQFGQLRYTSPISQRVLPLAPQSVPFVQPTMPANFSTNQNAGVAQPIPPNQETSAQILMKSEALSHSVYNQLGLVQGHMDLSQGNELTLMPARETAHTAVSVQEGRSEISQMNDNIKASSEPAFQAEDEGHHNSVVGNFKSISIEESEGVPDTGAAKEKHLTASKGQGLTSGGRGRKYVLSVRSKSSFVASESSRSDSSGFQRRPRRQRTEFRVRENADKQHSSTSMFPANHSRLDDKSITGGRNSGMSTRGGYRRVVSNKSLKQANESESLGSDAINSWEADSGSKGGKGLGKESFTKSKNIPHSEGGYLKRTIHSEEDVDAPLQSGVVRVFEQPGIEAPSDEDDFIKVRSKRQMLNDRREQREKEIKAKSRVAKMPRKPRSSSQSTYVSASSNKSSASVSGEAANSIRSDFVGTDGRSLANVEASTGFSTTKVSQPLAPIGTPAVKADSQADLRSQTIKSLKTSSIPVLSGSGKNLASGFIFDSKNKVLDNVPTSMGSWGNSRLNQQVMALTQTQLDEAMNPAQFDSRVSVKDHTTSAGEPSIPSSSILSKDKSFSSTASPINSLLAGEKIQFGAVTSPTVLPPSTRAVSHSIGPPGPCRQEKQIPHNISATDDDCIFFEKEKHSSESCVNLEDCEAEAEAAASAIAVAAISSDEVVANGLGTCPVSVSETKSFGGADIDGITAGVASDQQSASQSRAEESLSVALPADLSVETPPISLWPPPLPSPSNTSNQMISHFPGGPHSTFPSFYEMNPMLGGPIFTFGPHDESVPAQSQNQKTSTPGSSPLGTWQQCHSGVDSFYGPPAGYSGPFISPTGGIPGVQGPPHMVVYNHFAPVGQFGQVGLSFMGTTYIPSAKQPDWKRNPVSSAMGVGEGEVNNVNMVATQRNPTNLPAPIQHLAPGSPLLPMASPLAMFDVSPFQSSSDMSVQARWSHVPPPPLHSVPMSMPLQQQPDNVIPSQINHGPHVDQSSAANRFPESQAPTTSDSSRNFHVATDVTVTQLPDELGLVDTSSSASAGASAPAVVVTKSLSLSTLADAGKTDVQNSSNSNTIGQNTNSAFKHQSSQQKNMSSQQYSNSSGYNYQRGSGVSQKNSSGGDWSHRRMGFHGRNQSFGAEKGFPPSKMKQIYVAKQTTSGTSTNPS